MKEAKFKIGDRVKLVSTNSKTGKVMESLYSSLNDSWFYEFMDDEAKDVCTYKEEDLELVPEKDYSMTIQIDIANNVLIATLFEDIGDTYKVVAKGHGHLIHEGELGIAQAASYACKKLYESLGGTFTKGGSCR